MPVISLKLDFLCSQTLNRHVFPNFGVFIFYFSVLVLIQYPYFASAAFGIHSSEHMIGYCPTPNIKLNFETEDTDAASLLLGKDEESRTQTGRNALQN